MLTHRASRTNLPSRQKGVVLLIALIIMIALTLGGLALFRSVSTTTMIAGNLAFHQAATLASERAIDAASSNVIGPAGNNLTLDAVLLGYCASTANSDVKCPPATAAVDDPDYWETYWAGSTPVGVALAVDGLGNRASYVVQRLCDKTGEPDKSGCVPSPERFSGLGNSLGSGNLPLPMKTQVYYRITTRVTGPRNTVSYVQTIVAK